MSEGRRSQVVLLDERRLDIVIQSRLYAGELLDIVASHFNLKEKEYFGISYVEESGQHSWLQLDKRVLEHEFFPKKSNSQGATLTLYFRIKYFVESITQLRDSATIEAFYLQTKSLIAKGEFEVDSEIIFQLAALVVQATYGDYTDDQTFKSHLKRLPVLPVYTLKEYPSIAACEKQVLDHYKVLAGQNRGAAIVNYLSIVESLPTYGQHYYEIKDKAGNPCWLSLSYRGISQFDKNDRRTPRRVFLWKQLENLYFRDRKFTVEVHEARRVVHTLSSFNLYEDAIEEPVEVYDDLSNAICDPTTQVSVSRRAFAPASVTVFVWYAATPNIAKCIWSMAIAQHQFFLDRSHKKSTSLLNKSLNQIASELCRSVQSLSPASSLTNLSRSNSTTSLPTVIIEGEISEESKAATAEMLSALQSRKDALQDALKKKTEELKALCLKEGEITGELPPETPFQPGEAQPQVRRRIGTSFTISDKVFLNKAKNKEALNDLELDYEIQSKIAYAAFKLANDQTARKSVRKVRKISYQQATSKLQNIEEKLSTLKREKLKKEQNLEGAVSENGLNALGLATSSSGSSASDRSHLNSNLTGGSVPPSISLPQLNKEASLTIPSSPSNVRQRHQSLQHVPATVDNVYEDVGVPFSVRPRRDSSTSYSAASEYDAISCGGSSIASLGIPYRNRFEANLDIEGTNHYSVPNRRASQAFNDPEDLFLVDKRAESKTNFCPENNPASRYLATPLSCSYDDRISFQNPGAYSSAATECSFDSMSINSTGMGNLSYQDSAYPASCSSRQSHIFSDNSLHKSHSIGTFHRQLHISEPDLNADSAIDSVDGVLHQGYTLPLMRGNLRPVNSGMMSNSSTLDFNTSMHQSINQMAELVQACVLLQDGKRVASSGTLECSSAPKPKTKEWVETSLDSPVLSRKRKPKTSELSMKNEPSQSSEWLDNGLPSLSEPSGFHNYQRNYYDDMSIDLSTSDIRESPSPVLSQINFSNEGADYENVENFSPNPNTNRPHSSNSLVLMPDNQHLYEDISEISRNYTKIDRPHSSNDRVMLPDNQRHYENINELSNSCIKLDRPHSSNSQVKLPGTQRHYKRHAELPNNSITIDGRHSSNSQVILPDDQRHYENITEMSRNSSKIPKPLKKSSPYYENVTITPDLSANNHGRSVNISDSAAKKDHREVFGDKHITGFSVAQPQEPPKRSTKHASFSKKNPEVERRHQSAPPNSRHTPISFKDISHQNSQHSLYRDEVSEHPQQTIHQQLSHQDIPQQQKNLNDPSPSYPTQSFPSSPSPVAQTPTSPIPGQNFSFSPTVEVDVISVGHFQPSWEVEKPYELSDFYKYSTKHKKQQAPTTVSNNETQRTIEEQTLLAMPQFCSPVERSIPGSVCSGASVRIFHPESGSSMKHHQDFVTNNLPGFSSPQFISSSPGRCSTSSPAPLRLNEEPDKSLSLGEMELQISLADTFHDEMVAWYQKQESVKKATLV